MNSCHKPPSKVLSKSTKLEQINPRFRPCSCQIKPNAIIKLTLPGKKLLQLQRRSKPKQTLQTLGRPFQPRKWSRYPWFRGTRSRTYRLKRACLNRTWQMEHPFLNSRSFPATRSLCRPATLGNWMASKCVQTHLPKRPKQTKSRSTQRRSRTSKRHRKVNLHVRS